jgi:hypothetical protein
MTTDKEELKEQAEAISFWLDEQNSQARKELSERRPELAEWLQMIERKVNERLAQVEKEQEANVRA